METFSVPKLFGVARTGKVKQWQARVELNEDNTATIIVSSGYVGQTITDRPKTVKKGKNIGKANETTPFEQAVSQIESAWNKKRDQNYELEQMDPNNYTPRLMLPQLAKGNRKGKIVFPCFMQPKFNGICNLAEPTIATHVPRQEIILHHSRGGQIFETLEHLDKWIKILNPAAPLHGELYVHGWSLQKIGSYVKKMKVDQHLLEYWVYDMAQLKIPFVERFGWVTMAINSLKTQYPECPINLAPTVTVYSYEEAKAWHDKWVSEGYEGGMLKNTEGTYLFQYNSNDIEKVKEFEDAEFEIIGGKSGEGTDEDCIIYRCITENGKEFDARPRGTVEDRKQMLINLPNDLGKKLTIRFAEWSEDGVPLQPVGIPEAEAVRDYE